jgi:hypothetical protein
MQMLVTLAFDPARAAEAAQHIPAERARIRELMGAGTVTALYVQADGSRAWLALQVADESEARQAIESLPLHPYIANLDLAPLANLS